jgi:hypothetical protein
MFTNPEGKRPHGIPWRALEKRTKSEGHRILGYVLDLSGLG